MVGHRMRADDLILRQGAREVALHRLLGGDHLEGRPAVLAKLDDGAGCRQPLPGRRFTVDRDERRAEQLDGPIAGRRVHQREVAARDDQRVGRIDDVACARIAPEYDAVGLPPRRGLVLAGKWARCGVG